MSGSATSKGQTDNIENHEQYLLYGRGAIIQKLRQLGKSKNLITAHFGGGKYSLLTAVIDVMPDKNLLVLDYGANESLNNKILEAERVVLKTQHQGITAQFTVTKIQRAKLHGRTAFACPLPDSLLWVQRREYYRVKIPQSDQVTCEIMIDADQSYVYKVLDISIGGIALHNSSDNIAFEVGQIYRNCNLQIAETAFGNVDIEIRNEIPLQQDDPSGAERIGCNFLELAADISANIQRYIHTIDAVKRRQESENN